MSEEFLELKSDADWSKAWNILNTLKPSLDRATFLRNRETISTGGYMLFGLKEKNQLLTIAGTIFVPHIIDKSIFWILDMATLPTYQSRGYGLIMLNYLEKFARNHDCKKMIVHSRIKRDRAHDFYTNKCGFNDYAYLFSKSL